MLNEKHLKAKEEKMTLNLNSKSWTDCHTKWLRWLKYWKESDCFTEKLCDNKEERQIQDHFGPRYQEQILPRQSRAQTQHTDSEKTNSVSLVTFVEIIPV